MSGIPSNPNDIAGKYDHDYTKFIPGADWHDPNARTHQVLREQHNLHEKVITDRFYREQEAIKDNLILPADALINPRSFYEAQMAALREHENYFMRDVRANQQPVQEPPPVPKMQFVTPIDENWSEERKAQQAERNAFWTRNGKR